MKNSQNSHLESQQTPKYIFPNLLAKAMAKVDLRTQYEASMLSMTFIMVGLVVSVVYFIIYLDFALWYKIILGINGLAGVIFMSSYLITTYQQYKSYMEIIVFQNIERRSNPNGK